MAKTNKLDAQQEADVEYLSTILARGLSGLIEIGITDGLKLGQALRRVTASKANSELITQLWTRFFLVNPRAAEAVEAAALLNPKLGALLEKLRMKAKDVAPEDATVKDAKPC